MSQLHGALKLFRRQVDPYGPLATLRKLLLSTESMVSLRRWVLDNWWGVLLLGLTVLVFLVSARGRSLRNKHKTANVMESSDAPSTADHAPEKTTSSVGVYKPEYDSGNLHARFKNFGCWFLVRCTAEVAKVKHCSGYSRPYQTEENGSCATLMY